jgi:hypothetical protein
VADVALTAVGAVLIAWLPGALVFRLPVAARDRRAALPLEERAFWAIVLSIAWSLAVVLALAFLARYRFERLLLINAAVSALMALAFRSRLSFAGRAAPVTWTALLPLLLVALGTWLFQPPAEYVMGGKDPGVYINEGIQIAQRGAIVIEDSTIAELPAQFRDLFFPSHDMRTYYGTRFMGFFIKNPARGTVIGQFPHLFPASIAIGYGLDGLTGARRTVAFWGLLGLVAVYFVAARLIGPPIAALSVALLAINVVEVWFGRYPNAELVMQALMFAAMLAFARALDGGFRFFGPVAALLVGLQLFLRYDVILAVGTFAAAATLARFAGKRVGWGFGLLLIASTILGFWYLAKPMASYSEGFIGYTRDRGGLYMLAAGIAGAIACRLMARSARWSARVRAVLPATLTIGVVVLWVYGYFLREPGGRTAAFDAYAMRTFAWYVTPIGLGAAIVGWALLARRAFWRDPAFFLTVTTYSVFFFYKMRIVPEHFWSTRRFLAFTLPGLMVGLGGLVFIAAGSRTMDAMADRVLDDDTKPRRRVPVWRIAVASAIACAVFVPLAIAYWRAAAPVRPHVEYAGLIPKLESLAGRFGDNDLVLVESRNASDMHVLALPLAYIYARNVLVLNTPRPEKRAFEDFIIWAQSKFANVYFLGGGGTDLLTRHLTAAPVASERFQIPEYASPRDAYPAGVLRKEFDYGLYRIKYSSTPVVGPVTLHIGTLDDLAVVRFHAKEKRDDGLVFRWTMNVSYVVLPSFSPDAREVTIWMSNGGRPSSQPVPDVTVLLDDHVLGTTTPGDAVKAYTFAIPPDVARAAGAQEEPPRLQLRVPTWNPGTALGVNDTRNLGVIVTQLDVR